MALGIISSLVYTTVDQAGNPRTEGWFLVEYQELTYATGGGGLDLSGTYTFIDTVHTESASGAFTFLPRANDVDLPASTQSGANSVTSLRLQEFIGAASGTVGAASGFTELANGTAISGTRMRLHVVGY